LDKDRVRAHFNGNAGEIGASREIQLTVFDIFHFSPTLLLTRNSTSVIFFGLQLYRTQRIDNGEKNAVVFSGGR
jgi:hypothetical protein